MVLCDRECFVCIEISDDDGDDRFECLWVKVGKCQQGRFHGGNLLYTTS